ncbi:MAG TPA: hypothetical protein VF106_46130 [Actinophytocola sp.]
MLNPSRVWAHNPPQDCSPVLTASYSATDRLIPRSRIRCAWDPSRVIGSFAANNGTSARSRSRSTDKPSKARRATREMLSQITTSNRRFGCAASASRSPIPPSRGIGMLNRS